ncbi:hypothetical protein RRG08_005828 [Elysia crispata]|uniref:Uncharacterized protein n=1 Tax=Elysia crispata TaxID=231223 RepID=A0AAE1CVV1_9GAST|nr:hypothetical protein RRG08_005828 [Elysia crispata]
MANLGQNCGLFDRVSRLIRLQSLGFIVLVRPRFIVGDEKLKTIVTKQNSLTLMKAEETGIWTVRRRKPMNMVRSKRPVPECMAIETELRLILVSLSRNFY